MGGSEEAYTFHGVAEIGFGRCGILAEEDFGEVDGFRSGAGLTVDSVVEYSVPDK